MKDEIKKVIRQTVLGAIASILHNNVYATEAVTPSLSSIDIGQNYSKDLISSIRRKIIKNVLAVSPNGETKLIAGHRSHMSHRSGGGGGGGGHQSHYSHYSSYNSDSYYSHSSSSYSGSRRKSITTSPKKTYATYSLGDRTLRKGLYGADVSSLTALLVHNLYLNSNGVKTQKGYSLYDSKVTNAIKRFQKDAGLSQTGITNANVLSRLQTWTPSKTTKTLGVRDLKYIESSPVSGNDVATLITLLINAGFAPNQSKLQIKSGNAIYTEDVQMAVKMFQAYNGLYVSGIADSETISKLRSLQKK